TKTTDVVKEGDKVWVKLMGFDERGKVRLSMKIVDQQTGKEITGDDSIKTEKENCLDEKNKSENKRRRKKKEE
ncbi:MAG: hypothetical protein PV354_10620, partial [Bartonella sp.]|nr:hypothetical protein [Bartonella sp.]